MMRRQLKHDASHSRGIEGPQERNDVRDVVDHVMHDRHVMRGQCRRDLRPPSLDGGVLDTERAGTLDECGQHGRFVVDSRDSGSPRSQR